MKTRMLILSLAIITLAACNTLPTESLPTSPVQHDVNITVQGAEVVKATENGNHVSKSVIMEIPFQGGQLSRLSFVCEDEAFIKIFGMSQFTVVQKLFPFLPKNMICKSHP